MGILESINVSQRASDHVIRIGFNIFSKKSDLSSCETSLDKYCLLHWQVIDFKPMMLLKPIVLFLKTVNITYSSPIDSLTIWRWKELETWHR